jgi:leucyl-tRNA synthetase
MSKSKKNIIEPTIMIEKFGADAVRLFILSDSPPEKDVQWSEQGMVASYKFIQKFWILHQKIKQKVQATNKNELENFNENIEKFTNQILQKINFSLSKFSYNVIVANLHEIYNFFNKVLGKKMIDKNLLENYIKILKVMIPITPHLANECLTEITLDKVYSWPKINNKYLENKSLNIVIQINGKKRGLITSENGLDEKDLIKKIEKMEELKKFFDGKSIIKSIFIKDKLINLIIK